MDSDKLKSLYKQKKSVEVYYVPDEIIEHIIPNDSQTPNARHKNKKSEIDFVKDCLYPQKYSSPGGLRKTRSGRHITNQFGQLSLNSPEKQPLESSELGSDDYVDVEKPEEHLFGEGEDNQAIFSFRTPKRQNGMVTKASESVTKSRGGNISDFTPKKEIPRRARRSKNTPSRDLYYPPGSRDEDNKSKAILAPPPTTPYSLRNKIRKRLADEAQKQELDRLLEDSGSDFVPSSSDSESESSSESDSDSAECGSSPTPLHSGLPRSCQASPPHIQTPSTKPKTRKMKDYVFRSDDYFDRQYARIMTSNNKLSKLKSSKIPLNKLSSILRNVERKHTDSIERMDKDVEKSFKRWMFAFSEGFNVMLYGLGSKIRVLEKFHSRWLKNCYVLYIRGYFPDNSIKEILNGIASSFLGIDNVPAQAHEVIDLIKDNMAVENSQRLFILISNMDGKFLQNEKSQKLLSQLISLPKVHCLATVDHINSPLLWDQSKLSAFNFIWEDATTFCPYTEETSYESSVMVHWSGGIALSSIKNVFSSLTINSRKVFKILLKHHLENIGPKYSGMHFSDLYRECRSGFVVSSDLALRTLLTEFMDHQIVKWRKETDHLLITVETSVLRQFQAEIDCFD